MEAAQQSQLSEPAPAPAKPGRRVLAALAHALVWALPLAGGLAMRLAMLKRLFIVSGDSLIYGGLGKTLLDGRYGLEMLGTTISPTLIRLPGYPLYLALCFRFLGMEDYFRATLPQIFLELLGCLLLADFAGRIAPPHLRRGARLTTLWIACLCPFTASYAVVPLTESLTLFTLALALWAMARFRDRPSWPSALAFTFAVTYTALLRPDGVLAAVALAPALVIVVARSPVERAQTAAPRSAPLRKLVAIALVCTLLALAPFAAWTLRNWRVFHVFEPLAPRYAVDPGQSSDPGWQSWIKTWCLDFTCTYNVYWEVPGDPLDIGLLPARAFDSSAQFYETAAIISDYNNRDNASFIAPDVDARFAALARERTNAHLLRSYLVLPIGRLADMWVRPRVENLNIDLDWWAYARHNAETRFSWEYAALNALYLLLAAAGLALRPRFSLAMLAYMLLRSALLLTVEAPETRYTLECFPMLFALGGVALSALISSIGAFFRRAV
jgi:hypothetical protein